MKYNKIWGLTKVIFENSNFEVHRIEAKKGGFSSEHKHVYKFNLFYVESGKIRVHVWKSDYKLCDITELLKGEKTNVQPGEWHKFEAIENSIVYEIYYSTPIGKDIERRNVGGNDDICIKHLDHCLNCNAEYDSSVTGSEWCESCTKKREKECSFEKKKSVCADCGEKYIQFFENAIFCNVCLQRKYLEDNFK